MERVEDPGAEEARERLDAKIESKRRVEKSRHASGHGSHSPDISSGGELLEKFHGTSEAEYTPPPGNVEELNARLVEFQGDHDNEEIKYRRRQIKQKMEEIQDRISELEDQAAGVSEKADGAPELTSRQTDTDREESASLGDTPERVAAWQKPVKEGVPEDASGAGSDEDRGPAEREEKTPESRTPRQHENHAAGLILDEKWDEADEYAEKYKISQEGLEKAITVVTKRHEREVRLVKLEGEAAEAIRSGDAHRAVNFLASTLFREGSKHRKDAAARLLDVAREAGDEEGVRLLTPFITDEASGGEEGPQTARKPVTDKEAPSTRGAKVETTGGAKGPERQTDDRAHAEEKPENWYKMDLSDKDPVRVLQLYAKRLEYAERIDKPKKAGTDDREAQIERDGLIHKQFVLAEMLRQGKLDSQEIWDGGKKVLGPKLSVGFFEEAVGIIMDYAETGGENIESSAEGLPKRGGMSDLVKELLDDPERVGALPESVKIAYKAQADKVEALRKRMGARKARADEQDKVTPADVPEAPPSEDHQPSAVEPEEPEGVPKPQAPEGEAPVEPEEPPGAEKTIADEVTPTPDEEAPSDTERDESPFERQIRLAAEALRAVATTTREDAAALRREHHERKEQERIENLSWDEWLEEKDSDIEALTKGMSDAEARHFGSLLAYAHGGEFTGNAAVLLRDLEELEQYERVTDFLLGTARVAGRNPEFAEQLDDYLKNIIIGQADALKDEKKFGTLNDERKMLALKLYANAELAREAGDDELMRKLITQAVELAGGERELREMVAEIVPDKPAFDEDGNPKTDVAEAIMLAIATQAQLEDGGRGDKSARDGYSTAKKWAERVAFTAFGVAGAGSVVAVFGLPVVFGAVGFGALVMFLNPALRALGKKLVGKYTPDSLKPLYNWLFENPRKGGGGKGKSGGKK